MLEAVRCRLGRHNWVMREEDGQTFGECSRCSIRDFNRYKPDPPRGPATPGGIGQGMG